MIRINLGLVQLALESPHSLALTAGSPAHEPATRWSAQLVRYTADPVFIVRLARALLPENYSGNTLDELPGMVRDALAKGFADPKASKGGNESTATRFLKQVASTGIQLFRNRQGDGFISVPVQGGGRLNYPVRSERAKTWLRYRFFQGGSGKPIAKHALDEVVETLEARALFESSIEEVHLRIGGHDGWAFIDLGRQDGSVVQIRPEGWLVTVECPIRFYRPPGFAELPNPETGGDLKSLRALLGLDERNWVLLLSFIMNCLKPDGPYMCLLVGGEQGSGKSLLCSLLKRILDPNAIEKLRLPKTEHDLMIQANENALLVFDNASSMKWDLSDALCALATGSGFNTRKYYTDNESRTFKSCRPVVINGIGEFANRPDLLERSFELKLPAMSTEGRKTEKELVAEFGEILPFILGRLYDAVAHALKFTDKVEPPRSIRMADAAQWLVAAEPALGFIDGMIIKTLESAQTDMMTDRAVNDPLVVAILKVVEKSPGRIFDDTIGKLLADIQEANDRFDKSLPPTPAHLSNALQRLRPMMARIGLAIEFGAKTRKGKNVRIAITEDDLRAPSTDQQY
jgi:hypothetical protein